MRRSPASKSTMCRAAHTQMARWFRRRTSPGAARMGLSLVMVALITAGATAWMRERASVPSLRRARFTITLPTGDLFSSLNRLVALSPDGTIIRYTANQRLHLRAMDRLDGEPIPGTETTGTGGGESPFFSPDGQWIGFWQSYQFKKVSITGGAPMVLCSARAAH